MPDTTAPEQFVLNVNNVSFALKEILNSSIHPTFSAYLCIKQNGLETQTSRDLQPNFKQFFVTYLAVSDGSVQKPYILPFTDSDSSSDDIWFNKNVAGSYAPSSIREQSPLRSVCKISGKKFSLVAKHSDVAKTLMLHNTPVNIFALVIFLYRDFVFEGSKPLLMDLVNIFKSEFGYRNNDAVEAKEYSDLFIESDSAKYESELFIQRH